MNDNFNLGQKSLLEPLSFYPIAYNCQTFMVFDLGSFWLRQSLINWAKIRSLQTEKNLWAITAANVPQDPEIKLIF